MNPNETKVSFTFPFSWHDVARWVLVVIAFGLVVGSAYFTAVNVENLELNKPFENFLENGYSGFSLKQTMIFFTLLLLQLFAYLFVAVWLLAIKRGWHQLLYFSNRNKDKEGIIDGALFSFPVSVIILLFVAGFSLIPGAGGLVCSGLGLFVWMVFVWWIYSESLNDERQFHYNWDEEAARVRDEAEFAIWKAARARRATEEGRKETDNEP